MEQENCSKKKDNLKDKSDINKMKDMIKIIVVEMNILDEKIKLLENEFQMSKQKDSWIKSP
jgi:predicted nuclease with TOPRIM domain